jgi:hypothetical protein
VLKPATLQDHVRERPCQQVIQEAEQDPTGVITAAMLVADGDIDSQGMN